MTKSAMIHARIDPALKAEAETILEALGLSATQAITLFYQQIKLHHGLPFAVRLPSNGRVQNLPETETEHATLSSASGQELLHRRGI